MKVIWHAIALAWMVLMLSVGVQSASAHENENEFSGTLKKVKSTGVVSIGYRESSVPFSYLSGRGEPIGYAIDLCRAIVEAMSESVGRELVMKWVPVTSETRMDAVESGQIDLECGSTTNNTERQKRVAFSPITFVAGTRLLVKKDSTIKSFRDLGGKTVVVTAGTTNEKTMRDLLEKFKLGFKLLISKDHAESFAMVQGDSADTFATDDVLLLGLLAKYKIHDQYLVVGDFLSYDPYGIMFRKADPALARLINNTFHDMAQGRELEHAYNKWFLKRLPSGDRLGLSMSPQLVNIFASMATRPE